MYELTRASQAFFGTYDNGVGRERFTVREVLDDMSEQASEGRTFDAKSVLAGLNRIKAATRTRQELEDAGETWNWDSLSGLYMTAREAVEESGMSEGTIARLALSEVDPSALEFPISMDEVVLARVVAAARDVAHRFHQYSLMSNV